MFKKRILITQCLLGLVKFQKTKDKDGFVAELSATTEVESELYQVKLRTKPGGALFEASITHNIKSNTFSTKVISISLSLKFFSFVLSNKYFQFFFRLVM